MRYLCMIFLWLGWLTALGQPVLTITDARTDSSIEPFASFLEDETHKLTFEEVVQLPTDSFKAYGSKGSFNFASPSPAVWIRFAIRNLTTDELYLKTLQLGYGQLNVYVMDEEGRLSRHQVGTEQPDSNRFSPTAHPIIPLGRHPRLIYIETNRELFNEYLRVSNAGYTILERKKTGFWQGIVVGTYLLLLVFAVVFWIRLRLPILGWYALFLFTNIHWFLHRSGYLYEFLGADSLYFQFARYYPQRFIFSVCWVIFLIKVLNLKRYSQFLYNLLIGWICLDGINHAVGSVSKIWGERFAPLDMLLSSIGIDWASKLILTLSLLLISLVYVSLKNFREVRWYALAFGSGLLAMYVSMFALYHFSWLPYYPYNYLFVYGSVLEMIILAYALAERASEHRQQQTQTQQALIAQLEENLRQRDKLLRIRDEIARDLHDEVGSTLTSIAISTKLVQKKVNGQQPDIQSILQQIKADSEDTIHSIRDTVWALNPENDAPVRFLERLRTVAVTLLANQRSILNYESHIDPEDLPPFSMEQRRNIYLVYKEALHNILKHTTASEVNVKIGYPNDQLQISISDNGQGFDTSMYSVGNGLMNFKKRADEGNFTVEVTSRAEIGTVVSILIPLRKIDLVGLKSSVAL